MIVYDRSLNLDEAIVGVIRIKGQEDRVCYDLEKVYEIAEHELGCTPEEATEYVEFNVTDLFAGETTPAFLVRGNRAFVDEWADDLEDEGT